MSERQVKSALRVLEVLEYFAERQAPATVTEVGQALGYPQSSTSMLLATLESQGYLLWESEHRSYVPTLRVMLLGTWLHDTLFSQGSLLSAMEAVRRSTGLPVLVGVRQGIRVRFILSLNSRQPNSLHFPAGTLRPVCHSAAGKVLLAAMNDTEIVRVAQHANAEAGPDGAVSVVDLLKEVQACRRQGWAISRDYPTRGRSTLAVPMPALCGQPAMALALGSRRERLDARLPALVEALQGAVQALRQASAQPGPDKAHSTQRQANAAPSHSTTR